MAKYDDGKHANIHMVTLVPVSSHPLFGGINRSQLSQGAVLKLYIKALINVLKNTVKFGDLNCCKDWNKI